MYELSEETALLLYPWVFIDDNGKMLDKNNSPPYVELVHEIFPECFDIAEEIRIQLDEDTIEKMFVESNVTITEDLVEGNGYQQLNCKSEVIIQYCSILFRIDGIKVHDNEIKR